MWKLLTKLSALVFVGCIVLGAAFFQLRLGRIDWPLVIALSTFLTPLYAIRTFFLLRAELRRQHVEFERRRREHQHALGVAVSELIASMACLSPADLSIYQAILVGTGADETASIVTSKGSPNHNVLVQMADLKLATPEEFKTIGVPPAEFTMVRYALTDFCRKRLGSLMQDVLSHRALLQSQGGRI